MSAPVGSDMNVFVPHARPLGKDETGIESGRSHGRVWGCGNRASCAGSRTSGFQRLTNTFEHIICAHVTWASK
jgi:hypothetical protein